MKKLVTFFVVSIFLFPDLSAQGIVQPSIDQILDSPGKIEHHPEQGILPFNAPCSDCVEDLAKRTGIRREFYKSEGGSKMVYLEQSLGVINYKDGDGYWRSIDPIVKEESKNVFAARQQISSVVIDFGKKVTSLNYAGKEFQFNKNLSLSHISDSGIETNLGSGDWSKISRTENYTQTIFIVHDFYPGIDLQFIADRGTIETNFILNKRQQFSSGWLALNQDVIIPAGLHADQSQAENVSSEKRKGYLLMKDSNDQNYFYFKPAHAYDSQEHGMNYIEMSYTFSSDRLSYYVPVNWLNNSATVYPVVIDPLVTTSDSLSELSVRGSGYTPICGQDGCSYFMNNFVIPGGIEITGIQTYFAYLANLPCTRQDGGFQVLMKNATDTCVSAFFSCFGGVQGACFFWPATLLNGLTSFLQCIPSPQCAPSSVDFEMKLSRCNWLPVGGCDTNCIRSYSPWIMAMTGRTAEITNITPPQSICNGMCTDIAALADWGIEPYTYTWQPGNLVGDVVNVCPTTTTTYQLTVTDTCGNTDTTSVTVSVGTQAQNPGFTISPNDSVCGGTQLTFTANGNDPDSLFQWHIECLGSTTINDTSAVSYTAPNSPSICTVSMIYSTGTCQGTETDTFYVTTPSAPSVSITGSAIVCTGASGSFNALASFGGSAPGYQWFLNGVIIPTAVTDSFSSNFVSGDQLVVELTSNDPCSFGVTATDTILISVVNYVTPSITSHFFGFDSICSGDIGLFNSSILNGGTNPQRFWFLNGVLSDTGYDFETPVFFGDEIVVMLVSNYACTLNDTAIDTASVVIFPLTAPVVDIIQSPDTICAGDSVTFSAQVSNIALTPSYWWLKNGNFAGNNPTYTSTTLSSSDVIVLQITAHNSCGPDTGYDTVYVNVNAVVTPQVLISVSQDPSCVGDSVNLSALTSNGGTSPAYEWYIDGILSNTGSYIWSNTFSDGVSIWVNMQSSEVCATVPVVTDSVVLNIQPYISPQVSVQASDDTVCAGDPVTLTAIVNDAGLNPGYQWYLNGVPIGGASNSTYSTSPIAGNIYTVEVISSEMCADPLSVSASVTVFVENCLGIDKPSQSVFSLHPNPATDLLNIEFSNASRNSKSVFIIDALGRTLIEIHNVKDATLKVDLTNLAREIYFVKVVEGEREYLEKVVLE